jgi:hypothetical protein
LAKGLFRFEASIKSSTCCLLVTKHVSFHKYPRWKIGWLVRWLRVA